MLVCSGALWRSGMTRCQSHAFPSSLVRLLCSGAAVGQSQALFPESTYARTRRAHFAVCLHAWYFCMPVSLYACMLVCSGALWSSGMTHGQSQAFPSLLLLLCSGAAVGQSQALFPQVLVQLAQFRLLGRSMWSQSGVVLQPLARCCVAR